MERLTHSEEETREVGRALGALLGPGDFVGISGPLGAGKTRLVQGICGALGVDERQVVSPTFALVNTHQGRLPIFHVDLYRVSDADEVEATGILDLAAEAVTVVEWIDRVPEAAPSGAILVEIEDLGGEVRRLRLTGERVHEMLRSPLGEREAAPE